LDNLFVLGDVSIEAHPTAELMQRCLEMFYAAANQKLSHPRFMASDTEEVGAIV
jgi:hypothetical protein